MENNKLILKTYNIDYSFIIKNYTNQELWQKKWNIFQYKDYIITIQLSHIYCEDLSIVFLIKIQNIHDSNLNEYTYCSYNLNIENINILKKQINTQIKYVITKLEEKIIKSSDNYEYIMTVLSKEEDKLRDIASKFLDDNNVTNKEIRETYIDSFTENNSKIEEKQNDYIDNMHYKILTDLWVVFGASIKDDYLLKVIKDLNDINKINDILNELKENEKYLDSEEYINDMQDNLENI